MEHPNVLFLHEVIDDNDHENIYLVTEYYSEGSIGDQIKKVNQKFQKEN